MACMLPEILYSKEAIALTKSNVYSDCGYMDFSNPVMSLIQVLIIFGVFVFYTHIHVHMLNNNNNFRLQRLYCASVCEVCGVFFMAVFFASVFNLFNLKVAESEPLASFLCLAGSNVPSALYNLT